jgi:hypothetical protein
VYEEYLNSSSTYFQKACSGKWLGKGCREVKWPIDSYAVLKMYTKWLYSERIAWAYQEELMLQDLELNVSEYEQSRRQQVAKDPNGWTHKQINASVLAILYVAADVLLDNTFKAAVIDEMLEMVDVEGREGERDGYLATLSNPRTLWASELPGIPDYNPHILFTINVLEYLLQRVALATRLRLFWVIFMQHYHPRHSTKLGGRMRGRHVCQQSSSVT